MNSVFALGMILFSTAANAQTQSYTVTVSNHETNEVNSSAQAQSLAQELCTQDAQVLSASLAKTSAQMNLDLTSQVQILSTPSIFISGGGSFGGGAVVIHYNLFKGRCVTQLTSKAQTLSFISTTSEKRAAGGALSACQQDFDEARFGQNFLLGEVIGPYYRGLKRYCSSNTIQVKIAQP